VRRGFRAAALVMALPLSATTLPAQAGPVPKPVGAIRGTVYAPAGGPAADVCVSAAPSDDPHWSEGWAITEPDGSFDIQDLEPGDYIVHFEDCAAPRRYPSEYFENALTAEDATPVPVAPRRVTSIVATMDAGASITGTLTDDAGEPAPGVCVFADADGSHSHAYSNDTGRYVLGGLRPDAYVVAFGRCLFPIYVPSPHGGSASPTASVSPEPQGWPYGYIGEFYDDAESRAAATPIALSAGELRDGIDATLERASGIEVELIDDEGLPAAGVCVTAEAVDGSRSSFEYDDGDGRAILRGLTAGPHVVHLSDCSWDPQWRDQWFDRARTRASATVIEVPPHGGVPIVATMERRPMPDLEVSELAVRPVPLQTDAGSVPGPGTQREITVLVDNIGNAAAQDAQLVLTAQSRTDRQVRHIAHRTFTLPAGRTKRFVESFDATGMVGDLVVRAEVCAWPERERSNNVAEARSYAVIGGTGIGVDAKFPFGPRPQYHGCGPSFFV